MNFIQIGIVLSFAFSIIIGLFVGKKIKNNPLNFTVAGRKLPAILVSLALLAQAIDGNATLGNTQLSFDFGFWAGASLIIGLALSLFILGKFFAVRLYNLKLTTIVDLFEIKYGKKIGFISAIILLLGFGVLLAGNIAAVGILLNLFFNIKYTSAVIISCLVVLLYIFRGGILSDVYVDIFQLILISIGVFSTLFYLIFNYGFLNIFETSTIFSKFNITQLYFVQEGALINWATIFALAFGNLIAIDFGSRIFSAKSGDDAKKGCYWSAFLTLLIGLPFSFIIFYLLKMNVISSDVPIIITLAQNILPPFFGALLIAGIINAALSTIDGAILSMGNILTHNLIRVREEESSDKQSANKTVLYFLRISLIPIACSAMIFALLLPSPGVLLSVAFDITFASLLIPFIFAFSHKLADSQAALYAIVAGGVSRVIFITLTPTLFGLVNPFYIQNSIVSPSLDGLGTILAPLIALVVYLVVIISKKKSQLHINNI